MIDIKEKKEKIISFLENNGPSLPVRISGVIEMEPVFASAILSELYSEGKIKMSHMKVGSTHLYFLPGQEQRLENFFENLKPIEKEALMKLKDKKILDSEDEEPAIRVALSGMKDFAINFIFSGKSMWKYSFVPEQEINEILNPKKEEKNEIRTKVKKEINERLIEEIVVKNKRTEATENKNDNETKKIEGAPNAKKEIKSEFYEEVEKYLIDKGILIYEKIQIDKKEIIAKIKFDTAVGELNYLLVAKNKKSVSKDEFGGIVQRVSYHRMPCLLIVKKEVPKSLYNLVKENNLIKIETI